MLRYTILFEEWPGCYDHPFPCPSMRRPLCAPMLQQHTSQSLSISLAMGVRTRVWPRVQFDMVLEIAARLSRRELCRDGLQQLDSPSVKQAFVIRVRGVVRVRNGATEVV